MIDVHQWIVNRKQRSDSHGRLPFGPYMLRRLYGISQAKATGNQDAFKRLSRMKPEARRYTVKLILLGETHAS